MRILPVLALVLTSVAASLALAEVPAENALSLYTRSRDQVGDLDQFDLVYKSVDWDLLGFFMALFVVIYVMEHAHVLALADAAVEERPQLGTLAARLPLAELVAEAEDALLEIDSIPRNRRILHPQGP